MTEVQLPAKRPATDPKKVRTAIVIATVSVVGMGAAMFSALKTSNDLAAAATSVSETTAPTKSIQYQVGAVGVVSVVDNGNSLSVASVTPLTGWAVFNIEQSQSGVTVLFKSMGGEVTFSAVYQNGTVTTGVSSTNVLQVPVTVRPVYPVVTPTTVKPKPTTTTVKPTTTSTTTTTVAATTTTVQVTTTTQRRRNDD
jgi:hypothetical protein